MDYFSDPTPSKKLGQNFLRDRKAVEKVLRAADLGKKDFVLEIGPGLGALIKDLALKSGKVIAVEKDERMVKTLKERLGEFKNLEIIQGDILKTDLNLPKDYKVVANLPFYVATHIIRRFLEDVKFEIVKCNGCNLSYQKYILDEGRLNELYNKCIDPKLAQK